MTRPEKLNELLDLILELQNSYCGLTYDEMQEIFGFPRRRLERMMSIISEKFGEKLETLEYSTDKKKHFRFKKGTANFLINFTAQDFALLDALKNSSNDIEIKKQADRLIKKVKSINPKSSNSLETDIVALLENQGYAVKQYLKEKVEPKTYEIIKDAILEQKKLKLDYTLVNGEKYNMILHPYGIQFWENNYLVAFSEYNNQILKYKISKIENLQKTNEYFEKDESFDLKTYSEQSFGIYNSESMNIELVFSQKVKNDVLNYHFHPTQKIIEQNDGSVKVKFTASGEMEIIWNLFKWGNDVKILKPLELKNYYKNYLEEILQNI